MARTRRLATVCGRQDGIVAHPLKPMCPRDAAPIPAGDVENSSEGDTHIATTITNKWGQPLADTMAAATPLRVKDRCLREGAVLISLGGSGDARESRGHVNVLRPLNSTTKPAAGAPCRRNASPGDGTGRAGWLDSP